MGPIPLPGPLRATPAFPFAGRARELDALRTLLPRVGSEGGRTVLITGEPGSGKSRLVRELAHTLHAEGALVVHGSCDIAIRAPFGPFVEALDHLVRHAGSATLREDVGATGGELTRLLPELGEIVGDLLPPLAADADTERHRLHMAVTQLLRASSTRTPLLLVLEDVHWADAATLLLLRHLARAAADARVLIVATLREATSDATTEVSGTLVDIGRTEGVVRMRLGGLSTEELAEFVRLAAGVEALDELTAAIEWLTDGNPFLVTQLWRELVESGAVAVGPAGVYLMRSTNELGTPESVREVVSHQLARLAPGTVAVLETAAVAGYRFELDILRHAAVLEDEAVLLDGIDEALRSGFLVETPSHRLAYRFTHELVRRSVSDRLGALRRAELHQRVAEAMEQSRAPGDARSRLAALAHHYAAAVPVGESERAVAYNLLAAESAAAALAFDEAAGHLRVALELGLAEQRERAAVYLDLGLASHRAGRAVDALEAFTDAAQLARAVGDAELLARAAVGFEEACWRPGIYDAGSVELLEEAAAAIGDEDSESRASVLGGLARALDFRGESRRAARARDESIAMARRRGDRKALARTLAAAYWSRGVSTPEEVNAMLAEAQQLGEELGDAELQTEAFSWLVPSYVTLCDHDEARSALERLFESARRSSQPFHLHVAEHYASALALCDGDLHAAEAAAGRSHEWSRLLTGRDASGVHGIQMFGLRREQGRLAELAPVVRVLARGEGGSSWRPGLVAVLADLGMEEEARRELRGIHADGLDALRPALWLASLVYLTDACSALRDQACAETVYAELEPYGGGNIQIGHLVACYGSADRYLGMLAAVLGDWDTAERHFEAAMVLNRALGADTWLAHTAYEYARALLDRGRSDAKAAAAPLLGEALFLSHRIGLVTLASRIEALGEAAARPTLPDGLTGREAELLTLVARGLSNREIGARLFISEHTAANHVRSILRKTGSANRTEAAAYAHRRGLADD